MRNKRAWNPEFIKYERFIVLHKNYADMPNKFKPNGEILWVSPSDKLRASWWDKKVKEFNCSNRAEVARLIHPKELKGLKPCQICGKELSIFYIYPNKNTLKKLNSISAELHFGPFQKDISQIVTEVVKSRGTVGLQDIKNIFQIPPSSNDDVDSLVEHIYEHCKSRLSPGAMSNPPDRLDGFHTYNACCRSKEDTGRFSTNLARYTQDRRVYENWAEGDWNWSNRLMGEFNKYNLQIKCPDCGKVRKMTADHIGPISLGFTHRPRFNPLCKSCNSKKNNRMTFDDVQTLINDEKTGDKVISWHSQFIWDRLKLKVKNQQDALLLSKLMRTNLHHVLILFSKISEGGFDSFLTKWLHPEYSYIDYRFKGFDPIKGPLETIPKPLDSKNKVKNAKRYIRISFESLEEYKNIENRNTKVWDSPEIDNLVDDLLNALSMNKESLAESILKKILEKLSIKAEAIFDAKSSQNQLY